MKDITQIRVDSLVEKMPRRGKQACELVGNALILFVCWLLFQGGWQQTVINIDTVSPVTGWPMAVLYVTSVVASIGIALYAFKNIICLFLNSKH